MDRLLRFGRVVERLPEAGAVRVELTDETDGAGLAVVTAPLPVLQPATLRDRVLWLPDIGEHVTCLFAPWGGGADGVVLGAIYSASDAPPEAADGERVITFEDGTRVSHDRATSRLTVEAAGPVILKGGPTVFIGGEDGAEPIPLGAALKTWADQLVQWLNAHTHISAPSGSPTAIPTPFSAPTTWLSEHNHTT